MSRFLKVVVDKYPCCKFVGRGRVVHVGEDDGDRLGCGGWGCEEQYLVMHQ